MFVILNHLKNWFYSKQPVDIVKSSTHCGGVSIYLRKKPWLRVYHALVGGGVGKYIEDSFGNPVAFNKLRDDIYENPPYVLLLKYKCSMGIPIFTDGKYNDNDRILADTLEPTSIRELVYNPKQREKRIVQYRYYQTSNGTSGAGGINHFAKMERFKYYINSI